MAFGDIRRHCCTAHFDQKPLESWRCGTRWHRVTVALRFPAYSVSVAGFVELRDESQKSDRFVLRLERIEGNRIVDKPQRIRLSVRRGMAPPAGAFVEAKAQLNPPLQPLRPGSYDFARDLYFQRIGASGFVHGAVKVVAPPAAAGWRLRAVTFVESVRDAIDGRIRSVLSGDVGSRRPWSPASATRLRRTSTTRCSSQALDTCSRSPAITWRWSPASCSSFCSR